MSKTSALPKAEKPVQDKPKPAVASPDSFVSKLSKARTANEMTSLIGLKPIRGRSGPKVAY